LNLTDGHINHIGYDTEIEVVGKGLVEFDLGVFNNVLYVLSLEANLLSIYQMTHIGSPKQVFLNLT